jgi:hypothetical protein
MATHFDRDPEILTSTLELAFKYHPAMREAGVKVVSIMARSFDANEEPIPAVKLGGCPCLAKVRTYNLKQRHLTGFDAEIMVDGDRWDDLEEGQRIALLDHELNHLQLCIGMDGRLKLDDLGRPKLKTIPDDWMLTGFTCVIERHGKMANEATAVERAMLRVKAALKVAAENAGEVLVNKVADRAA